MPIPTTTDTEVPTWLNLDAIVDPDLVAEIPKIAEAVDDLLRHILRVLTEHEPTCRALERMVWSTGVEGLNEVISRAVGFEEVAETIQLVDALAGRLMEGQSPYPEREFELLTRYFGGETAAAVRAMGLLHESTDPDA